MGRLALVGILLSIGVAVGLGVWLPEVVTLHVLRARAEFMGSIGNELAARGLLPVGPPGSTAYHELDEQVRLQLIGGETVRVKVWTTDGTIVYSDDPQLIGQHFGLSPAAQAALGGATSFKISDLSEPAHATERYLGQLLEFFVPVHAPGGAVVGLMEVEQRVGAVNATRRHVEGAVWLSVGLGVGLLGLFMGGLTLAGARTLSRRRQQAEALLGELIRVQEKARLRIVGSLHDDVGQPLYRLLYGLEGSRSRLGAGHPVATELAHLEDLVREVDRTLRAELRFLHRRIPDDLDLPTALTALVDMTRRETGLAVELAVDVDGGLGLDPVPKAALIQAAGEAVTNARKHAEALTVTIRLSKRRGRAVVEVDDDGKGVSGPDGLGITTTRERLQAIGGGLVVHSRRGGGTSFRAWVPIHGEGGVT